MVARKIKITRDNGIYGVKEYDAYQIDGAQAIVVYKGEKLWTLHHINSGLSVDSLIPVTMKRSKTSLVAFVTAMEAENKDAFWTLGAVTDTKWNQAQKDAAKVLIDWAREYQP